MTITRKIKETAQDIYENYVNHFLTIEKCAIYYGLPKLLIEQLIDLGRDLNNGTVK